MNFSSIILSVPRQHPRLLHGRHRRIRGPAHDRADAVARPLRAGHLGGGAAQGAQGRFSVAVAPSVLVTLVH